MDKERMQQRLQVYINRNTDSDCWEWTGQVSNSGYGRVKVRGEDGELCFQTAQYACYEAFIEPLPHDCRVMQLCGNRLCVNPAHLALSEPDGSPRQVPGY